MQRTVDVAVVGGGVIGCSVAYHAARGGANVALFEAAEVGSGASGAAAGMLNAQSEDHDPGPLLDLLLLGRERHRELAGELYEDTGLDPEYIWSGTLRVARDEAFAEKLSAKHNLQKDAGLPVRWLDAAEARELEPGLSPDTLAALYLPEDGQVNPPRLVQAFLSGAVRNGAEVLDSTRVNGFITDNDRVTGVRTARGAFSVGSVVLAGGAGSGALAAGLGLSLPVFPVKGEILTVTTRPLPISANVWDDGCYLVPKRDGRVVIGATEEPGVHDRRPTLGGVATLSEAALGLIPGLSGARFAGAWGGLRPGTPGGYPVLGPVEDLDGLILSTGHHRNGVLLSAVTGEEISARALGEPGTVDLSPFSYDHLPEQSAV